MEAFLKAFLRVPNLETLKKTPDLMFVVLLEVGVVGEGFCMVSCPQTGLFLPNLLQFDHCGAAPFVWSME